MSDTAGRPPGREAPIPFDEALARLMPHARPVAEVEQVSTLDADRRVLAAPVISPLSVPSWDNASMDGYAVRSGDLLCRLRWRRTGLPRSDRPTTQPTQPTQPRRRGRLSRRVGCVAGQPADRRRPARFAARAGHRRPHLHRRGHPARRRRGRDAGAGDERGQRPGRCSAGPLQPPAGPGRMDPPHRRGHRGGCDHPARRHPAHAPGKRTRRFRRRRLARGVPPGAGGLFLHRRRTGDAGGTAAPRGDLQLEPLPADRSAATARLRGRRSRHHRRHPRSHAHCAARRRRADRT